MEKKKTGMSKVKKTVSRAKADAKLRPKRSAAKKPEAVPVANKQAERLREELRIDDARMQEMVRVRAYFLWLARSCPHGSDWQDWFHAEKEIKGE